VILLPPSEGKAAGGTKGTKWNPRSGSFGEALAAERREVIAALVRAKGGDIALLGVKGDHLARAREANVNLVGAPSLPAWQRYTGVVWDHLDIASLTTTEKSRALSSIIVVSGLLGLVRADDPTPDYRLKMSARLAPLGNLATWWRDSITSTLAETCAKHVVIDLLPLEHRKALAIEEGTFAEYFRIGLFERGGKAGGHDAKAAKGRLARHLITNSTKGAAAALKSFRDPQYVVKRER
jgi:cytoplasmic iron level regulating protein YaaA (DUF328/UPF0246 family)